MSVCVCVCVGIKIKDKKIIKNKRDKKRKHIEKIYDKNSLKLACDENALAKAKQILTLIGKHARKTLGYRYYHKTLTLLGYPTTIFSIYMHIMISIEINMMIIHLTFS